MEKYFVTDEIKECYKSLEFAYEELIKCENDSYRWKWAIIGMHNALQNFMVSALRDGIGNNILKERARAKHYDSIRQGKFSSANEPLNFFLELYNDIKSDVMLKYSISKKYVAESGDDDEVKNLNESRNSFIHFIPMGIEIDVLIFINSFDVAVKIIKFLVLESCNILFVEQSERDYTIKLISQIDALLKKYRQII